MTTKNHKYVTEFNGSYLSVINQEDDFYLTSTQIGEALGYENPRKAINTIYDRNKALLDEYSVDTKMVSTDGKKYTQKVFNEEGVMLICLKSKQPQAIEFQKWAVRTLKDYRHGNLALALKTNEWIALNRLYLQLCERASLAKTKFKRNIIIERIAPVAAKIDAVVPDFNLLDKPKLDALSRFWDFYNEHEAQLNHSNSGVIAINMNQFKYFAECNDADIDIDFIKRYAHESQNYRFIETRKVNSPIENKVMHCWIFKPALEVLDGNA